MRTSQWEKKYKEHAHHQQFDKQGKGFLDSFASLLPAGSRILDIGCGDGRKAAYLLEKGYDVFGIDSSRTAIAHAKKISQQRFRVADATRLPFAANSFDAVLSLAVYHCLSAHERRKFVEEVRRVLRRGGIIYQLVLSSKDSTIRRGSMAGNKTYVQPSGVAIRPFTKTELKKDFRCFKLLKMQHRQRRLNGKNNAIFVMTMKKV